VERNLRILCILLVFLLAQSIARAEIPTFFNKPIDIETLQKTFSLTNRELIKFIKVRGLDVYLLDLENGKPV
jgi:hypothetical protein